MTRRRRNDPAEALQRALHAAQAPRRAQESASWPSEPGAFLKRFLLRAAGAVLIAVARAAYGVRLAREDQAALTQVCGFERPRPSGYAESLWIAGRRSGKSSGAAGLAVYEAVVNGPEHMRHLAAGQRGHVLVVSRTQRQAGETFRYARGIVEHHSELRTLVDGEILESQTGGEIRFKSGVCISVGVASASSLRGYTVLCAIVDEAAFLGGTDEESERDLEEVLSVLRYGMLRPAGALIRRLFVITSAGVRDGFVYETARQYRGRADASVLVAHGPSFLWNETLDRAELEKERARDPRRFTREVLSEFVDAIDPLLPAEFVEAAAKGREPAPLAPKPGELVTAAIDIATRRDSTALILARRDDSGEMPRVVVIGAWRWSPRPGQPLDITVIVREVVAVLRDYGCTRLTADQWSFDAVRPLFEREGIELVEHVWSQPSKLQKFNLLRDLVVNGRVSLPNHERLLSELRQLDETILPSGVVRIAARGRGHDDLAFACALAVGEVSLTEVTTADLWSAAAGSVDPLDHVGAPSFDAAWQLQQWRR